MKYRIVIAALFFIIPSLSYLSADIYRWTDSSGNVVYGNQPPSSAVNVKLMFRETPAAPAGGKPAAGQDDSSSVEAIIRGLDEEVQREEQARQDAESTKPSSPPSREERIAIERANLEKKIRELEALPLDHFGSQKNKRVRIGYYQYRLETLLTNPDDYFSHPEPFEGNVKKGTKAP